MANQVLFKKHVFGRKFDLYHPTYYDHFPGEFARKRVITVHDMIHELFSDNYSRCDRTSKQKYNYLRKADGIIAISNSTKRDIVDIYDIPENKIRVIYHANALRTKPQLLVNYQIPYLLYVGGRGGYKDFNVFLRAYANSLRMKSDFIIKCYGGGAFSAEERFVIDSLGLRERVNHFEGNDEALARLYVQASLLVYSSRYEGFGIPVLEAMHYGCPVVVANSSSLPEVAGEAAVYFEPGSIEDLTDKMEMVLYNDEMRRTLIQKGFERELLFSWDRCAQDTLKYYHDVIES